MKKLRIPFISTLSVFLLIVMFGCGTSQKKNADETNKIQSEVTAAFKQEQSDLLAKANEELSAINKKIMDLNDKIHEKGGKLTDAQNEAIDEFPDLFPSNLVRS